MADIKYDSVLGAMREVDSGSSPGGQGGHLTYTVNGSEADENGNFQISAESIGAAKADHSHKISEVDDLQQALDDKADKDHTHELVRTISAGDNSVTDSVMLTGSDNVIIESVGNVISITGEPFTEDVAASVPDSNPEKETTLQFFTGTQSEWDNYPKDPGVSYLVFLLD